MALANERFQVDSYPTPLPIDLIFYEVRDSVIPENSVFEYGTPHEDSVKYPNHKLIFVSARKEDGKQQWYYAADRTDQDEYNFSHTEADIGGTRFDAVTRTYVTPRADFNPDVLAMGVVMPDVPLGRFSGSHVLAQKQQTRIGQQELDSLYVAETHVYVKRCTISAVKLNDETGRVKKSITNLYYRGEEVVPGVTVEELAADPLDGFWGLQSDGVFRELDQLSENWFAIIASTAIPDGSVNTVDNPARTRVISRVTPLGTDLVFYEIGAMPSPIPVYGSAHYDVTNWPNHDLALIEPADETGLLFKFTYVANRANQDQYNFQFSKADIGSQKFDSVTRTYVTPRADFVESTKVMGEAMPDVPAPAFSAGYVLSQQEQRKMGEPEFDSFYVMEVLTYVRKVSLTDNSYDQRLGVNLARTTTLYYRGETISGTAIETLVADDKHAYWGTQVAEKASRSGEQLSANWFAVVEQQISLRRGTDGVLTDDWQRGKVRRKIKENPIPRKFRAVSEVVETTVPTDLVAADVDALPEPTDPTGDEVEVRAEKVNDFRYNLVTTEERDTLSALAGQQFAPGGAIIDSTEEIVNEGVDADAGFNVAESAVTAIGDGKAVKTSQTPRKRKTDDTTEEGWPQSEAKSVGQGSLIPGKFRGQVTARQATTQEALAASDVDDIPTPPTLSGNQVKITHKKVNDFRYEVVVDEEIIASGSALIGNEYGRIVPTETTEGLVAEGASPDTGIAVISSTVTPLGDGNAVKTTTTVDGGTWPDPVENEASKEAPSLIPAKYRASVTQTKQTRKVATIPGIITLLSGEVAKSYRKENADRVEETTVTENIGAGAELGMVGYDEKTGRGTEEVTRLYQAGETIDGTAIEALAADGANAYWGLQSSGIFRTTSQLSENLFEVTERSVLPESPINELSNIAKARITKRVTPLGTDVMFVETGAMPAFVPTYGSAHYDTAVWPNHKLSLITPADDSGLLYKFHYVANRSNQNDYNYEIMGGQQLVRTYIIPRADYLEYSYAQWVSAGSDAAKWSYPPAGVDGTGLVGARTRSLDDAFTKYAFIDDTLRRVSEEFDSLYVTIQRRYVEATTVEYSYDETLERSVSITKELIAPVVTPPTQVVGATVEIQKGNVFHDVRITQALIRILPEDEYPYAISSGASTQDHNFPSRLDSIDLWWASAWALNTKAGESYDEDFFFKFHVTDRRPGPYDATIYRYITDNPLDIKALHPITHVPQPIAESIGITAAWFYASDNGVRTSATAREWPIPGTIHDAITINRNGSTMQQSVFYMTQELEATEGFSDFTALTKAVINYRTRPLPMGLYEVSAVEIDITNLYGSAYTPPSFIEVNLVDFTPSAGTTPSTEVNIDWTPGSSSLNMLIYRSTSVGGAYALVASVGLDAGTYTNTGLTTATAYFYKVRVGSISGISQYSNVQSITTA